MTVLILGRHENGAFGYEFIFHGMLCGGPLARFHTYEEAEDAQIAHMQRLGVWSDAKKRNLIKGREKAGFIQRTNYPDAPNPTPTAVPTRPAPAPTQARPAPAPAAPRPSAEQQENSQLRNENLRLREDALRQTAEIQRLRSQLASIQQMISVTLQ